MNQSIMYIMSKIFRNILFAVSALAFAACSGNVDIENPGIDEVPEGTLRIFADKTTIDADGNDEVTFTVMFGKEEVSNSKTCRLIRTFNGDEKYMAYEANKFSTTAAGTYKFKAEYFYGGKHVSDNEVEIVANKFFTGEEKNYKRRYMGILFTSTGCTSCPLSAKALKELQEDMPGEISAVAFHNHFSGTDPMTVPETVEFNAALGGFQGLPAFFWNMRKSSYFGGAANSSAFAASLEKEKTEYQTYSGVAINTSYDKASAKLDIEVGVTSNLPAVFRYIVILVEDAIPAVGDHAQQSQTDLGDYKHDNAVRQVLTSTVGDRLNDNLPLNVGVEVKASKSVILDPSWNAENMRVVVAATTSEDSGKTWTVNNVNECKVGESVPYLYAE